jgi:hypothetical protein
MAEGYILLRVDPFIWEDESLTIPEKILLNFVFSFTIENKCCTVQSSWIAQRFGWTERFVNEMILMMTIRGWLFVSDNKSGTRTMSILIPGHPNPCLAPEAEYTEIE